MTIRPIFGAWPSLPLFLAATFHFRSHSNSRAFLQTAPFHLHLELPTGLLHPLQPPPPPQLLLGDKRTIYAASLLQ